MGHSARYTLCSLVTALPTYRMTPILITPSELASLLGLATRTIYNRLHTRGDLPPVIRICSKPRFALADVHAWIDAKRTATAPTPDQPSKRRIGRPTKAEQVARRAQES